MSFNIKISLQTVKIWVLIFCLAFVGLTAPRTTEAYPPAGTPNAGATLSANGPNVSFQITPGYLTDAFDYTICDQGAGCGTIQERYFQGQPTFVVVVWPSANSCMQSQDPVYFCNPAHEQDLSSTMTLDYYTPPPVYNPHNIAYTNYFATSVSGSVPYSPGQYIEVLFYQDTLYEQCGYFGCQSFESNSWSVLASYGIPATGFTCQVTTNNATVNPGSSTTFNVETQPTNGFNAAVNYTASISPSPNNAPTITPSSFTQNSPYSTTPTTVSTAPSTPAGTYTVTYTGVGDGNTQTCSAQLVVNPANADFNIVISPAPTPPPNGIGSNTNPNRTNIGTNVRFQVFIECFNYNGSVNNLTAQTTLTGVDLSLGVTSLQCGEATILTVTNTALVPESQQSTITNINSESIMVRGSAQL